MHSCAIPKHKASEESLARAAHHKDAWVISWEVQANRGSYGEEKIDKVIEMQRLRGWVFESLTVCRFPNTSLDLELEWYTPFLRAATKMEFTRNA
jgi:aldehyde:ferredoxin oxidoreductase